MTEAWGFSIEQLNIRLCESGTAYEVEILFKVDKNDHHRGSFDRLAKDVNELTGLVYTREDYEQYLKEDAVEDIDVLADEYLIPQEDGILLWNAPETAYSRLLSKRLSREDYVIQVDAIIDYDETTDTFRFFEYVTKCPSVDGILQHLKDLQAGISYGHFVESSNFLSCIESLDKFWD